ncbi:hypothetical protein Btru_075611 [Bulinus truncatus]|nr:hypothetical protein Btru_075611 [Bulinus truncatus]
MATDVNVITDHSTKCEFSLITQKISTSVEKISASAVKSDGNVPEQNVIIVENNGDIKFNGLDPSLLKCVKEVIEDVERKGSFKVRKSEDGVDGAEQQTTYIIGFSTYDETVYSSENNISLIPPIKQYSIDSIVEKKISTDQNTQEQVEISFVSCLHEKKLTKYSKTDLKSEPEKHSVTVKDDLSFTSLSTSSRIKTLPFTASPLEPAYKAQQKRKSDVVQPFLHDANTPSDKLEDKVLTNSVITVYVTSPAQIHETIQNNLKPNSVILLPPLESSFSENEKCAASSDNSYEHKSSGICNSDSSCDSFPSSASSLPDTTVYKCSECEYSSHNKHYYKQHVDLVHNKDRPFKCPHCDYAGKRRHALLEHMVVHSNQRPFTCDHCNASFRKKGHLTNHIKLHTSQKLVHCGVCNIQLPDAEAFEAHLRKIHNTDKLFKCKLCDHTVVDREVMLRHLQTHNQAVVYSCPNCNCVLDSDESLIMHMTNIHNCHLVKGSHVIQNVTPKLGEDSTLTNADIHASHTSNKPLLTNIMCSECGFVCSSNEVMQNHMWAHINKKSGNLDSQNVSVSGPFSDIVRAPTNTMGVLKMNVDLGQKSLPKDVAYQCTTCTYTSSDNSAFIKHMLAHKTQEKRRLSVDQSKSEDQRSERIVMPAFKPLTRSGAHPEKSESQEQKQSESGVPFIYDRDAARYRCIICGYHCEFQRTIKAHIWKHSGHQNIEYPTFDQSCSTKIKPASSLVQVFANQISTNVTDNCLQVPPLAGNTNSKIPTTNTQQPYLSNLPGNTVKLVNQISAGYGHCEGVQIKEVFTIPPVKTVASRLTDNVAFYSAKSTSESLVSRNRNTADISSIQSLIRENSQIHSVLDAEVNQVTPTAAIGLNSNCVKNESLISIVKPEVYEKGESMSSIDEGCTEPSVVVEVMDTVSSESGLTGLASQHGSPRILDLDGSGGEVKLMKSFSIEERRKKTLVHDESDSFVSEAPEGCASDSNKHYHSYSVRLRCPICDRQIQDDFKTHLLSCQKTIELQSLDEEVRLPISKVEEDGGHTEDTDSTESSDELSASIGFGQQQKLGICSSLLAVIEQLRERSRSESEEDKQGDLHVKKSGKKKSRTVDSELDSIDELQNIEKILESGGEKYRCSLCHYTSQRICNIKLHMKTHRQKKPSECSLCDFSSTSPEALQEHMLKHCKVRTYACKFCPQSFNHKSTLRAHLRAHKDQEPFLCAYCVFETTNPMEYREHMLVHSGCSSRLRCPGCELILNNKEELTVHLLKCKGGVKKNKSALNIIEKTPLDQEADKAEEPVVQHPVSTMHACVVSGCSYMSTSLIKLQEHLSVHCNPSLLVCNLCDFKALHSRSLKSHMKRHSNDQRYVQQPLEQYKCNLCGYVCHHLPSLKSHMWRHASDQSYSYEFTNDVINAAIDHDTRVEADGEPDDPELLDRVINSERRILEGELNKCNKGDGQRPICWVTFRCCSCGFETINKAKLNIHMRAHSDIIQQALELQRKSQPPHRLAGKRALLTDSNSSAQMKISRMSELV